MTGNKEVPELLAQFMEMCGETERWITVYEFRTFFHLDESSAHAISGFLHRIYERSFFSFPYRVKKIEKIIVKTPQRRCINRYLVKKRSEMSTGYPASFQRVPPFRCIHPVGFHRTGDHELCTDYDAVEIFNKVLQSSTEESEARDIRW